jgi:hypothetical protein
MVFCVLEEIRRFVCLKSFVIKRVSFPVYVKVANLGGSVDYDMSFDVLCVVCKVAWDCVLG